MSRPIWKGTISFGLVNIPVELHSAEKRTDLSFHLVDSRNNARIRYERINDVTGKEVPWDKIVKGYEFDDGNYVLLTDKDFERVAVEATKTIEIEDFVEVEKIAYQYFDKPYVLVPARNGQKPYVVLREALQKSGKAGIAKVVIRTRQYLAAILPQDDAMFLFVLRFANEIRKPKEFDLPGESLAEYKVSAKEIDLASQLIKSMTSPWKPERYHDEYREALMSWIEKKAVSHGHVEVSEPEEEEHVPTTNIVDIMDLLKKSMKAPGTASHAKKAEVRGNGHKPSSAHAKQKSKKPARKKAS
jgi:DNA end-binding protein Ku